MSRRIWLVCSLLILAAPMACAVEDDPPPEEPDSDQGDTDDGMDDSPGDGPGDGSGDDNPGSPDAGLPADQTCAAPGAQGNDIGVGEFCTEGGGECDDNDGATYCTVDYEEGAPPFCTTPCFGDGECGDGAQCVDNGGPLKGCVPACVTEGDQ